MVIALTACHKQEIPIAKHSSGEANESQVAMGQDYRKQIFFSLGDNKVISTNNKEDWDLAFESSPDGWHIILNTARGMAVHKSNLAFEQITESNDLTWEYDAVTGHLDSTAIGAWQQANVIYVINLGYNHLGTQLGYLKLKIVSVSSDEFTLQYGALSAATPETYSVSKNTDNLFTYYKLGSGVVTIAPENTTWDLLFTQYTHIFTNPFEAYIVTGVSLNRYLTSAAKITDKAFSSIQYDDVSGLSFSNAINYIGYDWKWFDFATSVYQVDPTVTYIIHTSAGYYYKLHFIDFYNSLGEKGYPKMEIQQL